MVRVDSGQTYAPIVLTLALVATLQGSLGCDRERAAGDSKQEPPQSVIDVYTPPAEGTPSLVQAVEAHRDANGHVAVVGKVLLPVGTKIWVELFRTNSNTPKSQIGMSETFVTSSGEFNAGSFEVPNPGRYRVVIRSHFNGAWQSAEVLAQVGPSGNRLPASALQPEDPEFPQSGGHLEFSTGVNVEPLQPELQAIRAVQRAKLFVQGKGQAVDTIEGIVAFLQAPGFEFYPGKWSSEKGLGGLWKVSLNHRWGKEEKVASWEYDPRTGKVRYLDPEAKMLSWIPAE